MEKTIVKRWPGRDAEMKQLVVLLCSKSLNVPNVFIYGPPSTGKSSIVRDCLSFTNRKFAYVQCTETLKPKILLNSIYTQLQGYKRKSAEGYSGLTAENFVEFLKELPGICKPDDRAALIVLDDVQWLSRSPILRTLLQSRALCGGASVSFVLISQQAWGCGEFEDLPPMPTIHFANYKQEQMVECLVKIQGQPQASLPTPVLRALCEHVVSMFLDTTRDLMDLATLVAYLLPCFVEPLNSHKVNATEHTTEQLLCKLYNKTFIAQMQTIRKYYEPGMRTLPLFKGPPSQDSLWSGSDMRGAVDQSASQKQERMLELPEMTKLLVVAAYIASYNKPTLDKQIFDVKARSGRVRGRAANMDSDRQVEAAKEARLKGPHSFPLQRLLTCLSYLYSGRRDTGEADPWGMRGGPEGASTSNNLEEDEALEMDLGLDSRDDPPGRGQGHKMARAVSWWRKGQGQGQSGRGLLSGPLACESADLQVHLSTLASMQLLSKAEAELADPLDGAKYICHISEECASYLACSLGMRIADYIKYV